MADIAGHEFDANGICRCGRHWTDIRNATASDLNQPGIAHVGNLNLNELSQIQTARQEEDARIEAAMGHVWRAR